MQSIPNQAFYECRALAAVIVPDNVISIGDYAFAYCGGITTVSLGTGVVSIGKGAFNRSVEIKTITFANTSDWYATKTEGSGDGIAFDVNDAALNASRLTLDSSYSGYYSEGYFAYYSDYYLYRQVDG